MQGSPTGGGDPTGSSGIELGSGAWTASASRDRVSGATKESTPSTNSATGGNHRLSVQAPPESAPASGAVPSVTTQSEHTPTLPGAYRRVRRRRRGRKQKKLLQRLVIGGSLFAVLVAAYVVVVALRIAQAASHLESAKEEAEAARSAIEGKDLELARMHLSRASDRFVRGRNFLGAWEVKVLRRTPVFGPNLKAAYALAIGGAGIADGGNVLLQSLSVLEDERGRVVPPFDRGKLDLDKLDTFRPGVTRALESVRTARATVESSPSNGLLTTIESARRNFLEQAEDLERALREASAYLEIAPAVFGHDTPKRYLVAIGNDAEMNAQGMVLAYAVLEVNDGRLNWSKVGSVIELELDEPVSVPLGPQFQARWSWANPDFAWQRTNVSASTEASGSLMAAMYASKTGKKVDGVVYIDGVAIGYLLEATGPLHFEDPATTLDSSNFAEFAMNRAYFSFPSQTGRKEFFVEAAGRALGAVTEVRGEAAERLGAGVARAMKERRLWMWSSDGEVQGKLSQLPLGGEILGDWDDKADIASFTLVNLGGNKVDYYLYTSIRHEVEFDSRRRGRVRVEAVLENRAPRDLPEYVGGATGPGQAERARGEYLGYFTWYAAPGSVLIEREESRASSTLPDAGLAAFSWLVRVPPGETRSIRFEYDLPENILVGTGAGDKVSYRLKYVPQPRFRPDSFESELITPANSDVEALSSYSKASENRLHFLGTPSAPVEFEAGFPSLR